MDDLGQESLGTGLERQIGKFSNMQNTVSDLYYELEELIKRCETLKKDCSNRTKEKTALQSEIDKLVKERDCLIAEVRDAVDQASHTTPSSNPGFDHQGKLNRKLWLLEQDLKLALRQIQEEKRKGDESVMEEVAISEGLRGRIVKLETALRKSEEKVREGEKQLDMARKEWELEMANKASQRAGLASELYDVKSALEYEKLERTKLAKEVERLNQEKMDLEVLARANRARELVKSPIRALQPQHPNILLERAKSPQTPSNKTHLETGSVFPSSPILSPTTSLAKRFAHLEERHTLLKGEYDKLRTKYAADLKHWKEYKAVETARIDLKRQRKAEKKQAKAKTSSLNVGVVDDDNIVAPAATVMALVEASDDSQSATPEPSLNKRKATPKDLPSSVTVGIFEAEDKNSPIRTPVTRSQTRSSQKSRPTVDSSKTSRRAVDAQVVSDKRESRVDPAARPPQNDFSTPVGTDSKKAPMTGRVTPWLGTGVPPTSATRPGTGSRAIQDEDVFGDQPLPLPSANVQHTPLVRDRGPTTSLRRNALERTVSLVDDAVLASTPGDMSAKKRKLVEMERLSPAQKAAELKKLSKMSTKEKREYYAHYKGKGRYLAPEEVKTGVYDEFEIDPERNEGENYQFHDVKRQKAERRLMHGGDCECCKEYYNAVGHIPRYNQGPQWKDPSPTARDENETSRAAELQEHQNKVSRHRETWRRPPTPPGYWNIGFPTTQAVAEQNAQADEMVAKREAEVRRDAAHRDSKWRKKQ